MCKVKFAKLIPCGTEQNYYVIQIQSWFNDEQNKIIMWYRVKVDSLTNRLIMWYRFKVDSLTNRTKLLYDTDSKLIPWRTEQNYYVIQIQSWFPDEQNYYVIQIQSWFPGEQNRIIMWYRFKVDSLTNRTELVCDTDLIKCSNYSTKTKRYYGRLKYRVAYIKLYISVMIRQHPHWLYSVWG